MIAQDKLLHFIGGQVIFAFVFTFFGVVPAMLATMIIGLGKEIYDYFHRENHTPEMADFLATVGGGVFAYIIMIIGK